MSEYQYYEFQAIDRPLTKDELEGVHVLSSRARISATPFVNEYQYGNFRGDERKLMEQLFDAHLYFANWGSRRLMLRLPTTLLPARSAEPYCAEDAFTCWTRNGHLLLDFSYAAEDGGEWDFETSFTLASFTTLRTELAAGDLRPLYLAWLSALTRWELEEDVDEDEYTSTVEPPVPAARTRRPCPTHRPAAGPGGLPPRRPAPAHRGCPRQRCRQRARESHLDRLAENTGQAWQDIAHLIGQKQPGPYDAAVTLLKDLSEVHDRAGTPEEFARRLHHLREQHRGKSSLMRRFTDAGLTAR